MKENSDNPEKTEFVDFKPREYQVELFEKAVKENIIVCLGTGSGKTFISVMLIKHLSDQITPPYEENGKRTIFLVNTVPLVFQQGKVIETHTGLDVGRFCGDMGVDRWNQDMWNEKFSKHNVLVMTVQIFADILDHGYMKLTKVNLVIMDECHHAVKDSPMVQVMKAFSDYPTNDLPRVLGMTAAIFLGNVKPMNVESEMQKLERTMRGVISTASDAASSELHSTKPQEKLVEFSYQPDKAYESQIKTLVLEIDEKVAELRDEKKKHKDLTLLLMEDKADFDWESLFEDSSSDDDWSDSYLSQIEKPKPIAMMVAVAHSLKMLGLWCTDLLLNGYIKDLENSSPDATTREIQLIEKVRRFLIEIKARFDHWFGDFDKLHKRFVPPRTLRLIEILQKVNTKFPFRDMDDTIHCGVNIDSDQSPDRDTPVKEGDTTDDTPAQSRVIIFVQRRSTAFALSRYLQAICKKEEGLSFMRTEYIIGGSEKFAFLKKSAKQEQTITGFRNGDFNVMVSTSVVEEGLDVPKCNVVIRFDSPQNYRSYLQSKGRARSKESYYFMMAQEGNEIRNLCTQLETYKEITKILKGKEQLHRKQPTEFEDRSSDVIPAFCPFGAQGPKVTTFNAIFIVNLYCCRLPHDRFTVLSVDWRMKRTANPKGEEGFLCRLRLPVNSVVKDYVVGDVMDNEDYAKISSAMKVCKMLYDQGELDDHLVPFKTNSILFVDKLSNHLGLAELEQVEAGQPQPGTHRRVQTYPVPVANCLRNCFPVVGQTMYIHAITYAVEKKTHEYRFPMLTLAKKEYPLTFALLCNVKMQPIPSFTLYTKYGIMKATINAGFTVKASQSEFDIIKRFHEYLFTQQLEIVEEEFLTFDPSSSKHPLLITLADTDGQRIHYDLMKSLLNPSKTPKYASKTGECSYDKLAGRLILSGLNQGTSDKREYFYVCEVTKDNPTMHMTNKNGSKSNRTYIEHYLDRYKLNIADKTQPLIEVKSANMELTCLRWGKVAGKGVKLFSEQFVPEVCAIVDFPAELYRKLQLLPSILYRVNGLLVAKELTDRYIAEVNGGENDSVVPVPRELTILTALTSNSANDSITLEQLEVLGDSFLKYTASVFLYSQFAVDEGKLTICRGKIICNANLYQLAKLKGIDRILHMKALQPSNSWLPPCFAVKQDVKEEDAAGFNSQVIHDKSIADSMEALIGAFLQETGEQSCLKFMKWLGLKGETGDSLAESSRQKTCIHSSKLPLTESSQSVFEKLQSRLDKLEEKIGYHFKERSFLVEALTHPSFHHNTFTESYQRLEFLGDAVLDYLITRHIYNGKMNPGLLTDLRSSLVDNDTFAFMAIKFGLHHHLKHLSPTLLPAITRYKEAYSKMIDPHDYTKVPILVTENEYYSLEDTEVPKALGDVFESVIGAVYLDCGMNLATVWTVVLKMMKPTIERYQANVPINPVRQFYESNKGVKFEEVPNPRQSKGFIAMHVVINKKKYRGIGRNKQQAKLNCAKCVLRMKHRSGFAAAKLAMEPDHIEKTVV